MTQKGTDDEEDDDEGTENDEEDVWGVFLLVSLLFLCWPLPELGVFTLLGVFPFPCEP